MKGDDSDSKSISGNGKIQETTIFEAPTIYDPKQESRMTRLGLNFRSFTKAPGVTAGQTIHGQVGDVEGANHHSTLQQSMKDRHLKM